MPDRYAIVGNVVSVLQTIDPANTPAGSPRPYRTDVQLVERGIRTFEEVGVNERPYIGVAAISGDYDNELNGLYDVKLLLKLVAHVSGNNQDARASALDAIENDIKAALHVDPTRGGLATWTKVRRVISDEADPVNRTHGTLEMDVLVDYEDDFLVAP